MINKNELKWMIHNLVLHPLSELVYWITRLLFLGRPRARAASGWVHDLVQGDSSQNSQGG